MKSRMGDGWGRGRTNESLDKGLAVRAAGGKELECSGGLSGIDEPEVGQKIGEIAHSSKK
jgi:hypothetical protein